MLFWLKWCPHRSWLLLAASLLQVLTLSATEHGSSALLLAIR